jgi:hypothetical protein
MLFGCIVIGQSQATTFFFPVTKIDPFVEFDINPEDHPNGHA